ncbi:hypothetical protein QX204_03710 [Nocardia sp. PE-7]|uniref:hypothetical protein n=1 Tax=Nocardia sp. PE-7 TaxID=3058426 RepID=UPI00265A1BF2|nr:hypothetical protein [Nocardia sp. PE-7]WKG10616.1 hypothetical protein QX204_03710 [Nocardia sp. PE-7]
MKFASLSNWMATAHSSVACEIRVRSDGPLCQHGWTVFEAFDAADFLRALPLDVLELG